MKNDQHPVKSEADAAPEFGLGKSIAFSLILMLLFLSLGEVSVRGWAYFFRDDYERYDISTGTFTLVPGKHGRRIQVNSDGFVGPELEAPGPDLYRIVTVGDSCTFGDGNGKNTYPAFLQDLIDAKLDTGLRVEVVNAGIQGLNSELALRRLKSKVVPLEPEVVTIYLGWNDLMKFDPLAQGNEDRWSGVARALDKLWLVKGLRKLVFLHVRPYVHPPAIGPESRTERFADFTPSIYEANLREVIATVRDIGARPILISLPSVVREDMTVADLRENNVMFPYFPSAYAVGDLLDLLAAYNRTIRRVGLDTQVPVADIAAHFEALSDVTPYFYDTMHAGTRGRKKIAQHLFDALDREGLLPKAAPTRIGARETAVQGG